MPLLLQFLKTTIVKFPFPTPLFSRKILEIYFVRLSVELQNLQKKKSVATQFLRFLLLPIVQQYIATALGEYPIIKGIITNRKFNDQTYTNRESFELIKTAQNPPK
ncbi:hypothetical protein RH08_03210 [Candidatus Liberibacter asiaticus]|uniref:Uncharacterized protein n=1 Tax=Candidatus Liberibacter asiaticus str. gxpsy TaxID=1174529 RepID=A0ABN4B152_LIBAS|nr:hypothetical protein WSI_03135 [Candidatus Liberibacter asiaticus str. gxpsy]ASK52822.1 hypothetical protein B2I23_03215 [Candidatus Liberibacter asiaticus]KIH95910.1 hypothetical protein RH08_03210 [Candidatus Liberibacter asiaticus]KPG62962.1 hypothetical protein AL011_03150 [Candidatus Liberibacter asiaticus]RKL52891.1 hypothetical protein D2A38_03245 [Candidatus Liberibacter asiaticus]